MSNILEKEAKQLDSILRVLRSKSMYFMPLDAIGIHLIKAQPRIENILDLLEILFADKLIIVKRKDFADFVETREDVADIKEAKISEDGIAFIESGGYYKQWKIDEMAELQVKLAQSTLESHNQNKSFADETIKLSRVNTRLTFIIMLAMVLQAIMLIVQSLPYIHRLLIWFGWVKH